VTARDQLIPVSAKGWRLGFANVFRKESRDWWGTNRWWLQALTWLVVVNGMLAVILFVVPMLPVQDGVQQLDPVAGGIEVFFGIAYLAMSVGVIILAHDEVVGEKQAGTAAWVLSKPVSRAAFLLGKLAANGLAILCVMVVAQGAVAYLLFALAGGALLPALPFGAGLLLVALGLAFFLCLSLLVGTVTSSRGAVLGVPLAVLFGAELLPSLAPQMLYILPKALPSLATGLVLGMPMPASMAWPAVVTALAASLFVAAALLRFQRSEL
jgi:ABC-2 type transport system permease protein